VRRPGLAFAMALAMLVVLAGPAPAANDLRTEASRVLVGVPIRIAGPVDEAHAVGKLNGQGEALASSPVFGCFPVLASMVADPGPEAHVLTVVPQRPGQFVQPSATGSPDPFAGPREVFVGSLALDATDPLAGPLPLLLAELPRAEDEDFLASVVERANGREDLPPLEPCGWKGTLSLAAEFERYHLSVRAEVPFTFSVRPNGTIRARVEPMTRRATAEDPDLGHCSVDDADGFPIRLTGRAEEGRFSLSFVVKGPEPDFTLSCDGGNLEIGGDYLRAAFQPQGRLVLEVDTRSRAQATAKGEIQGRVTTAKVTVRRG